jgi:hypothetical protein
MKRRGRCWPRAKAERSTGKGGITTLRLTFAPPASSAAAPPEARPTPLQEWKLCLGLYQLLHALLLLMLQARQATALPRLLLLGCTRG